MLKRLLLASAAVLVAAPAFAVDVKDFTPPSLPLGQATFPNGKVLDLSVGFGSGAFHAPSDPDNLIYTITDRGPNIDCAADVKDMIGLDKDAICMGNAAAKVFPIPAFTPTIYALTLGDDGVVTVKDTIPLKGADGHLLNGLSNPLVTTTTEGAYGSDGKEIAKSPDGFDSEGLVRLADGTFWIADEYGGSIAHIAADGKVLKRLVPTGLEADYKGASYPVEGKLPALVMKRFLNRGIESIALSPDGSALYFAIQSPLANPDNDAYKAGTAVRLYKLDLGSESVVGEYLYPIDKPETFKADNAKKPAKQSDVKVSEMAAIGPDKLIVLERISKTTKLYRVDLAGARTVPPTFDLPATSPTLEQTTDLAAAGVVPLTKTLVLDSDDIPNMPAKVEGVAILGDHDLVLISDNDFGIAGDKSRVVRVHLDDAVTN